MIGNKEGGGGNGGAGTVTETGALFPRLHVKETKRVGLRAPPRNKMALYEQLPFPSHRYAPPSVPLPSAGRPAGSATSYGAPQRSSYEGSMFFCPPNYTGMPWLPYMAMNTGSDLGRQPSLNCSTSSTVVDGDGETQQAPSFPATDSARPSSNAAGHGIQWASSHSNVSSISSKKARNDDDCTVPTYAAPSPCSPLPRIPTGSSDQFTWRVWQQRGDTANTSQLESSGTEARGAGRGTRDGTIASRETSKKADQGEENQGEDEQSEQQESAVVCKGNNESRTRKVSAEHSASYDHSSQHRAYRQCRQQKDLEHLSDVEGLRSSATASVDCSTVFENDGGCGLQSRKNCPKARALEGEFVRTSTIELGTGKKEKKELNTDGCKPKKQYNLSECRSSSSGKNVEDIETFSDGEASQHSQSGVWSESQESDASMGGCGSSPNMQSTSRVLVQALGQQEFWRARKLLQRQQKIFSGQVFELHRLIKVQRLLATSPNLLMGDGTCQVTADTTVETWKVGREVEVKKIMEEKQESKAGDSDQETCRHAMGKPLDSTSQSSTSNRVGLQPPVVEPLPGFFSAAASVPPVLNVTAGASTAPWGYLPFPKSGINNWYGMRPASNIGYMYQPYPGSFHPPPALTLGGYNGAYCPLVCAPIPMEVPSMAPFGLTGYEQQPDSMQDMYIHNSYQQQWQAGSVFCPGVASTPGTTWYGVPPIPYLDPGHRAPPGLYDGMTAGTHPSGHPSYLRSAQQNNAQAMPASQKVSFVPPTQWSGTSSGQPAGCEGDMFQAQGQWLSPAERSPRRFQTPLAHSSAEEQGVSPSQQAGSETAYGRQCSENNGSQYRQYRDCSTGEAVGVSNVSADKSKEKFLKRSRDNCTAAGVSVEKNEDRRTLMDMNVVDNQRDALPLFPLAPALNSMERGRAFSSHAGVIKAVPRPIMSTPESAAEILLSIQKQREE